MSLRPLTLGAGLALLSACAQPTPAQPPAKVSAQQGSGPEDSNDPQPAANETAEPLPHFEALMAALPEQADDFMIGDFGVETIRFDTTFLADSMADAFDLPAGIKALAGATVVYGFAEPDTGAIDSRYLLWSHSSGRKNFFVKVVSDYQELASAAELRDGHTVVPGRWDSILVERPWAYRIPEEDTVDFLEYLDGARSKKTAGQSWPMPEINDDFIFAIGAEDSERPCPRWVVAGWQGDEDPAHAGKYIHRSLRITIHAQCQSAEAASRAAQDARLDPTAFGPQMQAILRSLEAGAEGSEVTVSFAATPGQREELRNLED